MKGRLKERLKNRTKNTLAEIHLNDDLLLSQSIVNSTLSKESLLNALLQEKDLLKRISTIIDESARSNVSFNNVVAVLACALYTPYQYRLFRRTTYFLKTRQ